MVTVVITIKTNNFLLPDPMLYLDLFRSNSIASPISSEMFGTIDTSSNKKKMVLCILLTSDAKARIDTLLFCPYNLHGSYAKEN